jgi:pyridoxine kinase
MRSETEEISKLSGHVLSIQSHVVHGHVGNSAAVFPLQLHHYEVDAINSVQFSNHTQYKHVRGQRLKEKDLQDLFEGLSLNDLTKNYTHLLTGYIGDVTFLNGIAHVVEELRKKNPKLIYMCDPVLGDDGKLYVPSELVQAYKNVLVPLADIITPNHFEASILTDTNADDIVNGDIDIIDLLDKLHAMGPRTVILTSIPSPNDSLLTLYASRLTPYKLDTDGNGIGNGKKLDRELYKLEFPKIKSFFTGTGDLVASLILANMKENSPLPLALERAVASVQHVLKYTAEQGGGELRLIECWEGLINPQVQHHAEQVTL